MYLNKLSEREMFRTEVVEKNLTRIYGEYIRLRYDTEEQAKQQARKLSSRGSTSLRNVDHLLDCMTWHPGREHYR
jgi:hypothetical protein